MKRACLVLVTAWLLLSTITASSATSPEERTFARSVTSLTAADVTSNLRGVVGRRVAFVCSITSIVDSATAIGQCGKDIEPYDLYLHFATHGVKPGEKLRILGEMETPGVWVDVTGHPWYTAFVKARYVDRL